MILVQLYKKAKRRGYTIRTCPDADELIEWINEWHSKDAQIRYDFANERNLPKCERLFPLVDDILILCSKSYLNAT